MRVRVGVVAVSLFVAISTSLTFAQVTPGLLVTQAVDESQLVTLKGNTHPLARPQFDIGTALPDLPLRRMLLVLKRSPEQEFALRKLLDDQQDKASPNYHKWLTPDEFGAQFGAADQDIQAVTGWLQSHGLQVNRVTHGKTIIEFTGVESQVEEALHTQIHKYLVNGEEHWANASDPQIPAALVPAVEGVWSLHNFIKKPQLRISKEPVAFTAKPGAKPAVTFPDLPNPPIHALGPQDYAVIYDVNPVYQSGIHGESQTIAVVGRSDLFFSGQDVSDFRNVFGLCCGSFSVIHDGPAPGDLGGGEEAEATLDVTWSGAIAPAAAIDMVVSATTNSTDGVDLSEIYIVDNNLAGVMTESFGSCEAGATTDEITGLNLLAEQAAAQGITYMVSTGDNGAEGCDSPGETAAQGPVSVNVLASTAFNVAVGGTMFNENGHDTKYWGTAAPVNETALSYIPENVWNESCSVAQCGKDANLAAGSGGASAVNPKPSWQSGVQGIPSDGVRDLPDVSLTAAFHDPYLVCLEGSCEQGFIFFISGTSAAAPSFAGIMGLVDQKMAQSNGASGRQGQADYVLYRLAATENFSQCNGSSTAGLPGASCTFNDITVGNNVVPGEVGSQYQAGVGFDLASGLGSVNVNNLVSNWASVNFNPTTTTISVSPLTITHGAPINIGVDVAPTNGSGVPSGDVSLIADFSFSQNGVGVFPLSGGSVATSTSSLPGGQYFLTAQYGGDATFAPSVSAGSQVITVNPESSKTSLSVLAVDPQTGRFSPFAGGPYGSFVYLRADVGGTSGKGVATGSVMFADTNSDTSGITNTAFPLNSQGNTATPNGDTTLLVGQHTITAAYSGDPSFNPSTSGSVSFSITKAGTAMTLQAGGASQGAVLTATLSTVSFGNAPSGNVDFTLDGTSLGSAPIFTNMGPSGPVFSATFTDPQVANGTHTYSANYAGDTNYSGSNAGPVQFSLQPDFSISPQGSTFLGITAPGSSASTTLAMTDLDGFTGTVSFSCTGLPAESKCLFSPATLSVSGSITVTVTTTAKTGMLQPPVTRQQWNMAFALAGIPLLGIVFLPVQGLSRRWRRLMVALLFGVVGLGCGGGGGGNNGPPPNPGTPVGSSNVTVVATSGSITHSTTLTVVVE